VIVYGVREVQKGAKERVDVGELNARQALALRGVGAEFQRP